MNFNFNEEQIMIQRQVSQIIQRDYEWEKEKYSTFIDDIFEELDNGRQYFFGPIVKNAVPFPL